MGTRAEALASRVEQGAEALAAYAEGLADTEWQTVCDDGRSVGVLVHHVASQLIGETDVMRQMAAGKPFSGVSWAMVDEGNATADQAIRKSAETTGTDAAHRGSSRESALCYQQRGLAL